MQIGKRGNAIGNIHKILFSCTHLRIIKQGVHALWQAGTPLFHGEQQQNDAVFRRKPFFGNRFITNKIFN